MNLHLSDRLFDYVCLLWGWRATLDEIKAFREWMKKRRKETEQETVQRLIKHLEEMKDFLVKKGLM